jgi:3-dehydroquinate dehydratase-2
LEDVKERCRQGAGDVPVVFRQSGVELEFLDFVREAIDGGTAIILNPSAFTTTSHAIADALRDAKIPVIELHITNYHRKVDKHVPSLISPVATAVIAGLGANGYFVAVEQALRLTEAARQVNSYANRIRNSPRVST